MTVLAVVAACLLAGLGTDAAVAALPDGRAWEMVSPIDKNGGAIATPAVAGAGAFRAAADGESVAYASSASFGPNPQGAATFSQYIARRTASGWATENVTPAHLSGAYDAAPYVAFSTDLARSLYRNPARCPEADPCPPGYQLRDNATGALTPSPTAPGLLFAGASPSLGHVVFSIGDDLHLWSPPSGGLTLLRAGAELAGSDGAVSTDASRVYMTDLSSGDLHLREGAQAKQVDAAAGGDGAFETATADGGVAFFTKAGHLWRYLAATDFATDLTPAGGVLAVLGASADGGRVFYSTAAGIWIWSAGAGSLQVIASPQLTDVSAQTAGAAAGGARLFFTTAARLIISDSNADWDVYQWTAQGTGTCTKAAGCVALLSSGRSQEGATFIDASADGADVFFTTDGSLVPADPGSVDLYDARIGGGVPDPVDPIPCEGDSCQFLPPEPLDPALATLAAGPGNPAARYTRYRRRAQRSCRRARGKAAKRRCAAKRRKGGKGGAGRKRSARR